MNKVYPALTLWQPWASLVAWGEKQYETRGWSIRRRGLLAIHAASKRNWEVQLGIGQLVQYSPHLAQCEQQLPYGAVLCIVNVVDCIPTDDEALTVGYTERKFGNYAPGRYAWRLELVEVFPEPIPAKGAQGLWTWERVA